MATEYNNGDIAELILAAAIAAKFKKRLSTAKLSREQIISIGDLPRVTSGEVKETLITIISNSFSSQFNVRDRDIVNKRISRVTDNISVAVKIPANSERYMSAQPIGSRFSNFENIFNSATNFVNADTEIKRKVFNTQFNLKKDLIEIQGVGTKGQTTTKVDVRVDITTAGVKMSRTSSQISLKFNTGQFAQTVGLEFEKFADIFEELGITDLQHAENGGEYHIKELGYWVDGYSKEKNIVLEYYERAHKSQIEKDIRRKQEIINHLGCEFYEIWYDDIQ